MNDVQPENVVADLFASMKGNATNDWYVALVLAALDETQDLREAFALVDRLCQTKNLGESAEGEALLKDTSEKQ